MILIHSLSKKINKLQILKDINLKIEKNKITAIIGPNGSGKTTLIKCLLGLSKPDQGSIEIDSFRLNGDSSYRKSIGYMPQAANFPENLTVHEIIEMIKDLRENETQTDDELFSLLGLHAENNKRTRTLSGGTKQKLNAVIAFMFNPDLLILDEPTAGLDPRASFQLKKKIMKAKNSGRTLIITSHIMSEIQELADNIVFLLEGEIKIDGTVNNLIQTKQATNLEHAIANMMDTFTA